MQAVMFNSQHIPVSKDTLHSHEILRGPPEGKISSLLSQKDQKNEITHQRTSRAVVCLLDPLTSRRNNILHRQSMTGMDVERINAHNVMAI